MNHKVELKVKQEDDEALSFFLPTETVHDNVKAIIHQQNYKIAYLQEMSIDLENQFQEINNRIARLQTSIEKMKIQEGEWINEEQLAQNVASKIIIPHLPKGKVSLSLVNLNSLHGPRPNLHLQQEEM